MKGNLADLVCLKGYIKPLPLRNFLPQPPYPNIIDGMELVNSNDRNRFGGVAYLYDVLPMLF
jgi:hypothetical protein